MSLALGEMSLKKGLLGSSVINGATSLVHGKAKCTVNSGE